MSTASHRRSPFGQSAVLLAIAGAASSAVAANAIAAIVAAGIVAIADATMTVTVRREAVASELPEIVPGMPSGTASGTASGMRRAMALRETRIATARGRVTANAVRAPKAKQHANSAPAARRPRRHR